MFALNLENDRRVLSACIVSPATPEAMPRVETLPEGNLPDYRYEDGTFLYDPIPEPEPPTPEPSDLDRLEAQVTYTAMMTDTLLEG